MRKNIAVMLSCMLIIGMIAGCGTQKPTTENTVSGVSAADSADSTSKTDENTADADAYVGDGTAADHMMVDPEAEVTDGQPLTGSECIDPYTWQAEDGNYIQVSSGKTYMIYDKDRQTDGKVGFWKKVDDTTISLMDSNLTEVGILINEDPDTDVIHDGNGMEYTKTWEVMDGTYACSMNSTYLKGDKLTLAAAVPFWMSDAEVKTLKEGSIINHTDADFMGIEVQILDKKDDTHYVINNYMDLSYDETAGAWILAAEEFFYAQIGVCRITDQTVVRDSRNPEIRKMEDAFAAYDFVHASVSVEKGEAITIEIMGG